MLNNSPMKFNVPGKLVVPRINRNNEVENTGYMLNELMKAKVNRLRLSVRSYINPTEQNKPLELKPWASDVTKKSRFSAKSVVWERFEISPNPEPSPLSVP